VQLAVLLGIQDRARCCARHVCLDVAQSLGSGEERAAPRAATGEGPSLPEVLGGKHIPKTMLGSVGELLRLRGLLCSGALSRHLRRMNR